MRSSPGRLAPAPRLNRCPIVQPRRAPAPNIHVKMAGETQPETIQGTLEQILFVNEASGYVVARFLCDGSENRRETIAVVGNLPDPQIGMALRLEGSYEDHPRFGRQFRIADFEVLKGAELTAVERYL